MARSPSVLLGGDVCAPNLCGGDGGKRQRRNLEVQLLHEDAVTAAALTRL